MRLSTVRLPHGTRAAARVDDTFVILPATDVGRMIASPQWRDVADRAIRERVDVVPVASVSLAPVVPRPDKIVCCGHNYAAHIAEMGRPTPDAPTLFTKWADTLTGPTDDLVIDADVPDVDWEGELVVVVGAPLRRCTVAEAAAAVAGHTIANDVSVRPWQQRTTQWLPGKALDATTPLGPELVTVDEVDPTDGLRITCEVAGEVVQKASTDDLVFSAARLLAEISTFTTLRPGDLVLTGTPGGVGMAMDPPRFLQDGDVVVTRIEGLGELRNRVVVTPHQERTPS